jgi:hypothetical protein
MVAAVVLAYRSILTIIRSSGSSSRLAAARMIRRLAWCGTNRPRSAGARPLRSSMSRALSAMSGTARRKISLPFIVAQCSFASTVARLAGSLEPPAGTYRKWAPEPSMFCSKSSSPWPSATASRSTAPAPSPNRIAVARSSMSSSVLMTSTPITATFRQDPAATSVAPVVKA